MVTLSLLLLLLHLLLKNQENFDQRRKALSEPCYCSTLWGLTLPLCRRGLLVHWAKQSQLRSTWMQRHLQEFFHWWFCSGGQFGLQPRYYFLWLWWKMRVEHWILRVWWCWWIVLYRRKWKSNPNRMYYQPPTDCSGLSFGLSDSPNLNDIWVSYIWSMFQTRTLYHRASSIHCPCA